MSFFSHVKEKINRARDDNARERIIQKKVEYQEGKRMSKAKAASYKEKGLTDDEAEFMASRDIKRDKASAAREKRKSNIKAAIKDVQSLGEPVKNVNKKSVGKTTRAEKKRAAKAAKKSVPIGNPMRLDLGSSSSSSGAIKNPNKLDFKL